MAAMTAPAAIQGSYCDLRFVKTRSVAQVIVEIPIEAADHFIAAFGVPLPGQEKPVAIALLASSGGVPGEVQDSTENEDAAAMVLPALVKPFSKRAQHPMVTRAVMLCKDACFQGWASTWMSLRHGNAEGMYYPNEDSAREFILRECDIASRAELAGNIDAQTSFSELVNNYRVETGRTAEMRG